MGNIMTDNTITVEIVNALMRLMMDNWLLPEINLICRAQVLNVGHHSLKRQNSSYACT